MEVGNKGWILLYGIEELANSCLYYSYSTVAHRVAAVCLHIVDYNTFPIGNTANMNVSTNAVTDADVIASERNRLFLLIIVSF